MRRVPCQTPAGTTSCTCCPAARSGPRVKTAEPPVGMELQHLDRVAEIKVEDLVGIENMHLGEGSGLEQVVDGGALRRVHRAADSSAPAEV